MSRHRGAKRYRRFERLGIISLLSPEYLLFVRGSPSIRSYRETMTDFRLCSRCLSRSQASFCHCTQRPISDRSELTFARLRYSLGGDHPSQTTHHTLSQCQIHGTWLDIKNTKGGISRAAPPKLTLQFQSLPPILHGVFPIPI